VLWFFSFSFLYSKHHHIISLFASVYLSIINDSSPFDMPLKVQSPTEPALNKMHGNEEKKERKSPTKVEQIFRTWA
jgi:hypothetical protein